MGSQLAQAFPGKPTFTEDSFPSQEGKVFLVTGGYSGIGLELARMLYRKKGRVYIAGRSEEKAKQAIKDIRGGAASSDGTLEFLHVELDDLTSIKSFVDSFKAKESKLNVLWNNAGVSQPPVGSVSMQNIELQLATNCLGPFLLTQMLLPLLEATAADETANPPGSVRVVWASSQMTELSAPTGGIIMSEITDPPQDKTRNYTNSKTGNMFLAAELAHRAGAAAGGKIVSVSHNPGSCNSSLFRHTPVLRFLARPVLHKPELGALTSLYCGLSSDITLENNGCHVVPWGKIGGELREDLKEALKTKEDGGSGRAKEFWEFCEEKTQQYK